VQVFNKKDRASIEHTERVLEKICT